MYFGRCSEEKGIELLLEACKQLPEVNFVFAGDGSLKEKVEEVKNIKNVGFLSGKSLTTTIAQANFVVVPSIWYENCPFTVIEAQKLETPVIGSNIGGIPELIDAGRTGELFEAGNVDALLEKISELWNDSLKCGEYSRNCLEKQFDSLEEYCEKIIVIYSKEI